MVPGYLLRGDRGARSFYTSLLFSLELLPRSIKTDVMASSIQTLGTSYYIAMTNTLTRSDHSEPDKMDNYAPRATYSSQLAAVVRDIRPGGEKG